MSIYCIYFFSIRGNTVPKTSINKTSTKPTVGIRIMGSLGSSEPDYAVGECPSKDYHKLKFVLTTKKQLNSIMRTSTHTTATPFFLIMSFTLSLVELKFENNQYYVIQDIMSCSFPISKPSINENGIEKVIDTMEAMKVNAGLLVKLIMLN